MQTNPIHTVLVDDDEITAMGVERAFERANITTPIHVAHDGVEALEMLRGNNGRDAIPRPHVIFLDLNMPRMNGLEFLAEMRDDPELCDSVVFVLSTSAQPSDRQDAYAHAIAGYIDKSKAGANYEELLAFLEPYWRLVELPA